MSIVLHKANALETQLNTVLATAQIQSICSERPPQATTSSYVIQLNASLSILSAAVRPSASLDQVARLIIEVNQAKIREVEAVTQSEYAKELEWLFIARCTVSVYGCLLEQLFQQTLPLAQDIFYWDRVLSHPGWRFLFLIQSLLHI